MLGKPRATTGEESLDPLAVRFSECARRIVPEAGRRALDGELGRPAGPVDGRVGGPVPPAFFTRGPIAGRVPTAERR
jgi:hypothetical protein